MLEYNQNAEETLLMTASEFGNLDVVKFLAEKAGKDLLVHSHAFPAGTHLDRKDALKLAEERGHSAVVKYLKGKMKGLERNVGAVPDSFDSDSEEGYVEDYDDSDDDWYR